MNKCIATLNRLDIFWLHSNNPKSFKIRVYSAVIRSKLMYGLETTQLNKKQIEDINKFQLKCFRKILRWDTTHVNPANSNEKC